MEPEQPFQRNHLPCPVFWIFEKGQTANIPRSQQKQDYPVWKDW